MSGGLSQKHVGHKHEEIVLHLFALYLFAFTGFPIGLIELAAELDRIDVHQASGVLFVFEDEVNIVAAAGFF